MTQVKALKPIIHREVIGEVELSPFLRHPYDRVASSDNQSIFLVQGIVDLFTETRRLLETPLPVTSGYRTQKYQEELKRRGLKAANKSPHCLGSAFDIDIREHTEAHKKLGNTRQEQAEAVVGAIFEAAIDLDLRRYVRVGYVWYDYTIVHVDLAPLFFTDHAKSLPNEFFPYGRENPNPQNWRGGVTW